MRSRKAFHREGDSRVLLPSLFLRDKGAKDKNLMKLLDVISRNNEPICPLIIPEMTDLNIFPKWPNYSRVNLGRLRDQFLCKCVFHMHGSWVSGALSNYLIRALQLHITAVSTGTEWKNQFLLLWCEWITEPGTCGLCLQVGRWQITCPGSRNTCWVRLISWCSVLIWLMSRIN